MIKLLRKIHVKPETLEVIKMVIENYFDKGEEKSHKNLKKGDPVFYCVVSKYCPDTRFIKIMISYESYKKLKININ